MKRVNVINLTPAIQISDRRPYLKTHFIIMFTVHAEDKFCLSLLREDAHFTAANLHFNCSAFN